MTALRILTSVHGMLGVLAAAALFHPAILMRRGQALSRGARWSIGLSTAFAIAAFSLGIAIYESYRSSVKYMLFRANVKAGYLFETKEHLAFVVVSLAAGACLCAFASPRNARSLRQAAAATYLSAAMVATVVVCLGVYVTAIHTFPE